MTATRVMAPTTQRIRSDTGAGTTAATAAIVHETNCGKQEYNEQKVEKSVFHVALTSMKRESGENKKLQY